MSHKITVLFFLIALGTTFAVTYIDKNTAEEAGPETAEEKEAREAREAQLEGMQNMGGGGGGGGGMGGGMGGGGGPGVGPGGRVGVVGAGSDPALPPAAPHARHRQQALLPALRCARPHNPARIGQPKACQDCERKRPGYVFTRVPRCVGCSRRDGRVPAEVQRGGTI